MQMLGCRTAPAVAFDELGCLRTDYNSADFCAEFVNIPSKNSVVSFTVLFAIHSQLKKYSRAFLQAFCLLLLPTSTAGYLLR
jgi:hypothetical protein